MANRYGEAALQAVRMETYGKALTARERWEQAVLALYPTAESARKKTCPRGTFLGLCEAGLVKGIRGGSGADASKDGDYAVQAVRLLRTGERRSVTQLWEAVGEGRPHNSQMDVVLALWKNGLLAG